MQAEQRNAAWQPQAHHGARANARFYQTVCRAAGIGVKLGVGQLPLAGHQRDLLGVGIGGGLEHIGQHLMAQQIGALRPPQNNSLRHGSNTRQLQKAQAHRLPAQNAPEWGIRALCGGDMVRSAWITPGRHRLRAVRNALAPA